MAKIEKRLYRSVRKEDFSDGVLTLEGEAVPTLLHGDIDPRTVVVQNRKSIRQDWRRDGVGYFKTGHGTSLWDKRGVFGHVNWNYFTLPEGTDIPLSLKIVEGTRAKNMTQRTGRSRSPTVVNSRPMRCVGHWTIWRAIASCEPRNWASA